MDNFDGDFIQRHAKAVANYCHVHVICVVKDISIAGKEPVIEEKRTGNLTELVIYYNSVRTGIEKLDKYLSQKKYHRLYREAIKKYIAENGKPQLVHVHVAMKAGLLALWMQRQWNIPFIVSEHWTGYLPEADIKVKDLPFAYRKWLQRILTKASAITVVSEYLGNAIRRQFKVANYTVIPNVVDTDIFFPADKQPAETTRFIHVSNMTWQKNVEDILRSLVILKNKAEGFEMNIYGALKTTHRKMINDLELAEHVFLKGEVPQHELAKAIQQADALVLYSRFETFGCVLIEANACGVPAIVSDIEVFHELIKDGNNGIFVKGNNPVTLAEALSTFMSKKNTFNKNDIAQTAAAKYNFKKVAQQFIDLYDKIIPGKK
jgi:glycosyltransferase involved in cell wall biosynthesis